MFNDKPKEGGGSGIRKPSVEIGGVTIEPAKFNMPSGSAYGLRATKRFYAKGGQVGYRKAADGCVQRGKTRGKMV